MNEDIKNKIHDLIDSIDDEITLNCVMEDVHYYAKTSDIIDDLSVTQKKELNEAIKETDNNETINWIDFKNELNEWKKKL